MSDHTPIIDPKLLRNVSFGKSKCPECEEEELVFVGIMRAVDLIPDANCEVYQCLNCQHNMVFALIEDDEDDDPDEMLRVAVYEFDDDETEPTEFYCPACGTWSLECQDKQVPITEPCRKLLCRNCGQDYVFDGELGGEDDDDAT